MEHSENRAARRNDARAAADSLGAGHVGAIRQLPISGSAMRC